MILSPFKLERYFAKYEFNTEFLLCSSDCESMSIADLLAFEEGAAEKFQNHRFGYTESLGSPSLRKEIAGMYATTQPEDVLVFAGANEAIYLFMMAALKENDHIIFLVGQLRHPRRSAGNANHYTPRAGKSGAAAVKRRKEGRKEGYDA